MKMQFGISGIFLAAVLFALVTVADESILTSEALNSSLKKMERIQLGIEDADSGEKPDLLFQLGVEADALAYLLTNEVVVNNMAQKGLIELAMFRTAQMGVYLDWLPDKRRFIYTGDAFRRYLELKPRGNNAGESAFRLIEQDFFRSSGDNIESLLEAVGSKEDYLQKYADNTRTLKVGVLLAIDYRDLWRLYRINEDSEGALQFSEKTRDQFEWIIETHPDADEADIARGLLQRFESELDTVAKNPDQG